MKCYRCKTQISKSWRVWLGATKRSERSQFRDLCEPCYEQHHTDLGLTKTVGDGGLIIWVSPGFAVSPA